jgi:hypothetical protein
LDSISYSVSSQSRYSEADSSPTGVTRFNWTTTFPHFRPLHFAATSPLHHPTIPSTANPPSLLIVPALSTTASQLTHTQELAIKHGTSAILCSSTLSAVIDPAGRVLFQQSGGPTWSLSLALWFKEGEDRQWTGYGSGYGGWLFGTAIGILSICATISFIVEYNKFETEAEAGSATDNNVSGREVWSSLNSMSSWNVSWPSRTSWSSSSRK